MSARSRGLLAAGAVVALLGVLAPVCAAAPALALAGSPSAGGGGEVEGWIVRAAAAQRALAYSGTQLVATWSAGRSDSALLDVVHQPGRGLTTSPHDAGSGTVPGAGQDDAVTTPDAPGGTAYLTEAAAGSPAPLSLLMAHFAVSLVGTGQVAGRPVHTLALRRAGRTVARLWLDDGTGLMLRREVYDDAGRTVSAMAFLDVTVTEAPPGADRPAVTVTPSVDGLAAARRDGWAVPAAIGADLVLYDARSLDADGDGGGGGDGDAPIMHLSYSDGLTSLSVFEQRGRLAAGAVDGYQPAQVAGHQVHVRPGLPSHAVWQSGAVVVTVVSDEPTGQLAGVVAALPPTAEPPASGWLARAARDVLRAARWLTPLR